MFPHTLYIYMYNVYALFLYLCTGTCVLLFSDLSHEKKAGRYKCRISCKKKTKIAFFKATFADDNNNNKKRRTDVR